MSASPPTPSPPVTGAGISRSFSSVEAIRSSTSWAWIPSRCHGDLAGEARVFAKSCGLGVLEYRWAGGSSQRDLSVSKIGVMEPSPARDPRLAAAQLKAWALDAGFDRAGVATLEPLAHGEAFVRWLERGEHAGMA